MAESENKSVVKYRLTSVIFLLSIVGIVLSFFQFRKSIEKLEVENFKATLREGTQSKLVAAKEFIDDMEEDLLCTAKAIGEYDSIWDPDIVKILQLSNAIDIFDFTVVADTDGKGYSYSGASFDVSQESYFKAAMQGEFAFSEVLFQQGLTGSDVQICACPVWGEDNQVKAVVLGVTDLETFTRVFEKQNIKTIGTLYIIDSNGSYISRFQSEDAARPYMNIWEELEQVTLLDKDLQALQTDFDEKRGGEFSFYKDDQQHYGCYMPMGTHNWQILYIVKDTAMDKMINSLYKINTQNAIFAGGCYITLLLCVVWYLMDTNKKVKHAHHNVIKNMEILHVALQHSKQLVFEYDRHARELKLKKDFPNLLFVDSKNGIKPEVLVEKGYIDPKSVATFLELFKKIKEQASVKADIQLSCEDKNLWCQIVMYNIYDEKNVLVATVGFIEDITERKELEKRAKYKLEIQEAMIAKALVYVKVNIDTGYLVDENDAETNRNYENYIQRRVIDNVIPTDQAYAQQALSLQSLRKNFKQGRDEVETQFIMDCEGQKKWVSCMVYRRTTGKAKSVIIITDIDKQKREELKLKHQAEYDGLTGLYNAATVRSKIEEALETGRQMDEKQVFILMDLDNYKQVNDNFGHNRGDQVLVEVAKTLQKRFRSSDILGRMGGDEFVILLRNMGSYQHAEKLIQELCNQICRTYEQDGKKVTMSASVGVVNVPADGHTFAELYKKSDAALYQVKKTSKNGYQYYQEPQNE